MYKLIYPNEWCAYKEEELCKIINPLIQQHQLFVGESEGTTITLGGTTATLYLNHQFLFWWFKKEQDFTLFPNPAEYFNAIDLKLSPPTEVLYTIQYHEAFTDMNNLTLDLPQRSSNHKQISKRGQLPKKISGNNYT